MTGSLASVHPELIPEWSEKNLPLTPDIVIQRILLIMSSLKNRGKAHK